jgi:hypothetical protein
MKPINGITKIAATATAVSVTFALVLSIASFGYPGAGEVNIPALAAVAN